MIKRLLAFAAILALSIGTEDACIDINEAAYAATYHGCPADTVCLFQALNYQQERWQSTLANVFYHNAGGVTSCMNLAPAEWSNGSPVNDNSAGIVLNDETPTSPFIYYDLYVFNWVNCNPDGGEDWFPAVTQLGDLRPVYYVNQTSIFEYHTITSIELIPRAS